MKKVLLLLFVGISFYSKAEKDSIRPSLLDEIDSIQKPSVVLPPKPKRVYSTFGGTHLINGQSVETINKKTMAFIISHRFGRVNGGWREFFGLDQASIRFGFEYGILDNLT